MARIKFGMMMTDARGKLGGHVFSKTKSGAAVRTKVTPLNPQTTAQALARSLFGVVSQSWRLLSDTNRASWNNATLDIAKTNVFGDQYFSSGKNYFQEINTNLLSVGEAALETAPAVITPPIVVITSMEVHAGTSFPEIDVEYNEPAPGGDGYIIYEATPQASAGKNNFSGKFRRIAVTDTTAYISAADLAGKYVEVFGDLIVGNRIALRVKTISISGAASTYSTVNAIVQV